MKTTIVISGVVANKHEDIIITIGSDALSEADGKATARFIMAMYEECIVQAPSFMDKIEKLLPSLLKRLETFGKKHL